VSGNFSPAPAGIQVYVTTQDPDANLVKAVFTSNPGVAPIENLFAACKIDLQAGSNSVILTPQNGSMSH